MLHELVPDCTALYEVQSGDLVQRLLPADVLAELAARPASGT